MLAATAVLALAAVGVTTVINLQSEVVELRGQLRGHPHPAPPTPPTPTPTFVPDPETVQRYLEDRARRNDPGGPAKQAARNAYQAAAQQATDCMWRALEDGLGGQALIEACRAERRAEKEASDRYWSTPKWPR